MRTMHQLHGGDWAAYEREYGALPLDFSASVSPLGLPEGVREAAAKALDNAGRYPDPRCTALREALAAELAVPAEHIVCGNGAADLIDRLCRALRPRRALLPVPCFGEYRRALRAAGSEIQSFPLDERDGFTLPEALLEAIDGSVDILVLCQPNNPTGRTVEPELLRRIWRRCGESGTLLVLDECFLAFLDEPERYSLLPSLREEKKLVILRAFTKSHGLAGLRLGYALCADRELAETLSATGQPWPVSQPAQAAGLAALRDGDYPRRLHAWIAAERPRLYAGLEQLGLRVVPGEGNFLLFYSENTALGEALRPRGVLLRDCRDFEGLGPGWYRTAVRTEEENDKLLKALGEVLDG